jgi:hypothetical protein
MLNPTTYPTSELDQNTSMMNENQLVSHASIYNFDPPVFLQKLHLYDASSDSSLHSYITSTCNKDKDTGKSVDSVNSHEQRKVTFAAQSVITKQIPRHDLYHDEIPSAQWYSDDDYERIHQENVETIRLVKSGLPITESNNHCKRGLEEHFRDQASCYLKSRDEVRDEILDQQIELWREGLVTTDHQRLLAEAYSVYSRQYAFRAVIVGLHDRSADRSNTATAIKQQSVLKANCPFGMGK